MTIEPRPTNPSPLVRAPRPCDFPLSPGQERLWWLRQLDSSHHQYHVMEGWRFPALDRAALATALAALVHRHEILRTRFVLRADGAIVQQVADDVPAAITWAGREWRAAIDRAVGEPFDLASPPLFRVVAADLARDGHGLFIVLHHIVTDRWSMDLLERDLFELYAAVVEHRAPRLSDVLIQYGDYAAWHRRLLTSELIQPQLEYWNRALAGHERLELPLDRPRSTQSDAAGDTITVELPAEATAALHAMAWRLRASPVMVMTAALAAVLSTFTGQTDIVIGTLISDRPRPALQELIGFFVNTVILRIDLSGRMLSFREIVKRTRDAWMAADAHQDAPFEQIVGALNVGSETQRNPIFDVAVNHAGGRPGFENPPDAPTPWEPDTPVTARFDLSLLTQFVDDRLRATFLYRASLFDHAPIAALAARYARLLERGVTAPDRPLCDLELVDKPELWLLHRHNDTAPAPDRTVVELVQAQAARSPDAPAVIGAEGVLSYRELNQRANQLARHLQTYRVGPDRVIAVCLERTPETMVVLLAIAKTGSAYFPLDPQHPVDRLRFLLSDAGVMLTIVSPAMRSRLPPEATPVLVYGRGELDVTGHDVADLPAVARPDHLAYLISTSGSTGTPKAVAIPHRGLSRLIAGAPRYLHVGPGTTFLQAGPLTFDVSVLEWTPLAHGGCVAVVDSGPLLDGLGAIVRDCRVTTLKLVSPQLDLLVERDLRELGALRQIVIGGDVVSPRSFAAVRDALPRCRVMASYGPTECTVLATVFDDDAWTTRVPIGRAIPHTAVYVLDRDLDPVSAGMRGEIYIAGDGLARGYHGRPGLTAAAFLPDPYGPPGSRMYRTGDVGRYLSSGAIDFLGRADRQVKIRGFRIETGEIEHVLLRQPDITSAIVLSVPLATGPALVAYVVAATPIDVAAVRTALRAALPAYMIPDRIVELPRLPLTANNKLDRAALPPIDVAEPRTAPGAPPATALEARVVDAWSAVLGQALAGSDDFFDHGGHSLLVPQATAAVRRLLGREIPLRLMMQHRTPASYAAALVSDVLPDAGAAARGHHLEQHTWRSRRLAGDRRLDLFLPTRDVSAGREPRLLVVLDGSDFVDIMRLPAILDRLAAGGRIAPTAAIFVSPTRWAARNAELLDDGFVDLLADELVPHTRSWLGDRWPASRAAAVGASLGGVTAVRAALRRPDCFDGAIALSGPLTDHRLSGASQASHPTRVFLYASREESSILLDGEISLFDANTLTGDQLRREGHSVHCAHGDGGHTYAAWQTILPEALTWMLDPRRLESG